MVEVPVLPKDSKVYVALSHVSCFEIVKDGGGYICVVMYLDSGKVVESESMREDDKRAKDLIRRLKIGALSGK